MQLMLCALILFGRSWDLHFKSISERMMSVLILFIFRVIVRNLLTGSHRYAKTTEYFLKFFILFESTILPVNNGK